MSVVIGMIVIFFNKQRHKNLIRYLKQKKATSREQDVVVGIKLSAE